MTGKTVTIQWKKHVPFLGVLLLLFSAGAYISRPPWFDEVLTLDWLTYPFFEIPFRYTIPNNHIFYTLCLSAWRSLLEIFGLYGTLYLRILSLIFGACAIWLIARRLNRAGGMDAALPIVILLAGSGPLILFSTALRGYMPAMLFSFAAFLSVENWLKKRKKRDLLLYFLFCYCSVFTIPTNILSIGAGLLFLLPIGFRSRKEFFRIVFAGFLALAAFGCAYLPILRKFLKVSMIKEGWFSYGDFAHNYYLTLYFVFLPLFAFCIIGFIPLVSYRFMRWRLLCSGGVLVTPLAAGLLFQAAPFPRVFFPMIPLFALIFCYLISGYTRSSLVAKLIPKYRGFMKKIPLLISVFWLLGMPHLQKDVSSEMFGNHYRDDLLCPYPITVEFQPHAVAKILAQAYFSGQMEHVFLDFDADPPSLEFQLTARKVPQGVVVKDRPDWGTVQWIGAADWIVCRNDEHLEKIKQRFQLKGNYRRLKETEFLSQKIYVPE